MMHVVVLLGDTRLPYPYNLSHRYEERDYAAVESLRNALAELPEYRFTYLDDHSSLIDDLRRERPAFVFNRCDTGFRNDAAAAPHVPHLLEMLDLPYTGPNGRTCILCGSKSLVNLVAGGGGAFVPQQKLVPLDEEFEMPSQPYPGIIKPAFGYGSFGVFSDSVVDGPEAADRVFRRLHDELGFRFAVLEEYLPGPEYSMAVVGNGRELEIFPPLELDYSKLPSGLPPILPYESKVNPESVYWTHVEVRPAELSDERRAQLEHNCRRAFDSVGCYDHARLDFRLNAEGQPRLVDINPDPGWYPGGMFASMAGYAGYDYPAFVRLLLETGRKRLGV